MSADRHSLAALSDQLADAVAQAGVATVAVHARPRLASTGVHWRDGIVMTTEGTIRREDGITVTLPDGATLPATLAGRDRGTDLAVLRIAPGRLAVAKRGDPAALRPGHLVLALARLDELGARASFGAVSAVGGRWRCWKGGEIDRLVQSDLVIYPGFGGGPLVDATGGIHGLNSGGLSRSLATTIPAGTVDRVLDQLVERGYVSRGWLGAAMQSVRFNPAAQQRLGLTAEGGLVLIAVEPDGPSAAAGLLVGDVIVSVGGTPVDDPAQIVEALAGDVVGTSLHLDLVRGGQRTAADVLVSERPRERR
jgi:S1-C subfamily serine protease